MFENKNSKDLVLNLTYRPPNGDHKELENYFKISLSLSLSLSLSRKAKFTQRYNFSRRL